MPFGGLVLGPVPVGLPDSSCKPDGLAHLLGNHQEAESFFRSALSIHERLEAPYLIALTKLDYADLLIDGAAIGDAKKAREMIGQALDVAQEYGYGALERRAQGLLDSFA